MTWLICHCPTDLIVTSTAGSPMVWCARASSASDDRSGSPCAGSYMGDRYSSRRSCFLQKLFLAGSLGSDQGTRMVRKAPEDSSPAVSGPRYPVESVAKAAELLRLFAHHPELRLSDVGKTIGVSPSTAHRLLTTLEASGMISQNTTTRCYEPGPELLRLAQALTPSASRWSYARPFLADLGERVGATVSVVILHHTDAAFVESVEAQTLLRVGSRLGACMPASCVSGGKILLAALS